MIIDSHTHTPRQGAVFNIDPVSMPARRLKLENDRYYSVGIHPWNAGCYNYNDVLRMQQLSMKPQVVAIGETGLDMAHVSYEWVTKGRKREIVQAEPNLEKQIELLKMHIHLSELVRKPLILHVVKRYPEILKLRIDLKPAQPWIIHGFRGKPGLAKDLLKWGFFLSYGEHFNPDSVKVTPPERMLAETDDSQVEFDKILASLPVIPAVSLPDLVAGH